MPEQIDYSQFNFPEATAIAQRFSAETGVSVRPFEASAPTDPHKKEIVINGDGYHHELTRGLVKRLIDAREKAGMGPFSYVHIDGHDDTAEMYPGDDNSYKSFAVGIMHDNMRGDNPGVYFLEEGLTGERHADVTFLTPHITETRDDWGPSTSELRDNDIYISIDLDVLDAGVHHLFPQTPIGFTVERLLEVLSTLGATHNIIGADIVGFSLKDITPEEREESLKNITRIIEKLQEVMRSK